MMTSNHRQAYATWKLHWRKVVRDKGFLLDALKGFLLLLGSFIAATFANTYATLHASAPVADLVLSNIDVRNVFWWYAYGPMIFAGAVTLACVRWPGTLPFVLKSLATFFFVRSLFVCLTHLGVPPDQIVAPNASLFIRKYFVGGDFFFSGHVGMPLLMTMTFLKHPGPRAFFMVCVIIFAVIVLLGHYHYSIDVAGALLITPSIFAIAKWLFPGDWKRALAA